MCTSCAVTSTLYATSTLTTASAVTTAIPTVTFISPYGTVSTRIYTTSGITKTDVYTIDYFNGKTITTTVTAVLPGKTTKTIPTATVAIPTPCPTCAETLYDTSVFTTSVTTGVISTTSVPPYGTVSTRYTTQCQATSNGNCVRSTTSTQVYTIDYFYGRNITTTITTVVPVTSTKSIPTATHTVPCVTKRAEEFDYFEKRGNAGLAFQMSPKAGMAVLGFLFASLTMF